MLSDKKTIAKNTSYLYVRMFLIMLVSLYTVRAVLQALGVEDYGIYSAIGGVVTSLSFITGVMANASQRFFSLEIGKGSDNKLDTYFNAIFTIYIIISILIVIIIEIGGLWMLDNKLTIPSNRMSAAHMVLHMSLATFVVTVVTNPFQALLIAKEKMNVYAYVSIIEVSLKLLIVFLLYNSPLDKLVYYSMLMLGVSVLVNSIYIIWCLHNIKISYRPYIGGKEFKEISSYTSWTLFGTVSGVASIQGSSIILNMFLGPIANASFAIATQVSNVIQQFASSFYTAVRPPLTKSYGTGEFQYMNKLFGFSNKTLFTLTFIVVFPFFFKTEFILHLWLGQVSPFMVNFVRIMMIYAMILCLSSPITTIVQAAGKVKSYHLLVDGFCLLVLPLLYFALRFGLDANYCLMITVLIFTVAHFLRLIVLKHVVDFSIISYMKGFFVPACIVVMISILAVFVLNHFISEGLFMSLASIVLSALIAGLSSFLVMFSKEERHELISIIKKH